MRLDAPAPGIGQLFAMKMEGQVLLSLRFYLYGEGASEVKTREEPVWQAWVEEHFAAPSGRGPATLEDRVYHKEDAACLVVRYTHEDGATGTLKERSAR